MPLVVSDAVLGAPLQVQSGPMLWWLQVWRGIGVGVGRLLYHLWASPGAVRAKALIIADLVGDGCGYEDATLGYLGLILVGMSHSVCLLVLGPREQCPPARDTDTHLSRGS